MKVLCRSVAGEVLADLAIEGAVRPGAEVARSQIALAEVILTPDAKQAPQSEKPRSAHYFGSRPSFPGTYANQGVSSPDPTKA